MLLTLGYAVLGDKKLFKYGGYSGYIHLVPNKSAKLGLWHFELSIMLECGLPIVIYSKMQSSIQETNQKTKCHDIVNDWGCIILEKRCRQLTTLFMDNYYLTGERREWLKENNI